MSISLSLLPRPFLSNIGRPVLPCAPSLLALLLFVVAEHTLATETRCETTGIQICIPVEFILFAATLAGVALFHRHTLAAAAIGLVIISAFKLHFTGFDQGHGLLGLVEHLGHEWVMLGLLLGFAFLARHFEDSHIPQILPRFLPQGWLGGLTLLVMIFVLSGFLDNIAAALIGGAVAGGVYRYRVHIGYLPAIVAAANAGGAGSVVGDTTTTMMWLSGVSPLDVLHAYLAAAVALLVFGIPASVVQQRYPEVVRDVPAGVRADWARVGIVHAILVAAVSTNVLVNLHFKPIAESFPFLGVAVWLAIFATRRC